MCRYRAGTGTRPGRACGGTAAARGACRGRGAAVGRSVCVGGGSHSAVTGRGGPGSRGRPGRSVWWGHSGQGMFVGGPWGSVRVWDPPGCSAEGGGRSVWVKPPRQAGGAHGGRCAPQQAVGTGGDPSGSGCAPGGPSIVGGGISRRSVGGSGGGLQGLVGLWGDTQRVIGEGSHWSACVWGISQRSVRGLRPTAVGGAHTSQCEWGGVWGGLHACSKVEAPQWTVKGRTPCSVVGEANSGGGKCVRSVCVGQGCHACPGRGEHPPVSGYSMDPPQGCGWVWGQCVCCGSGPHSRRGARAGAGRRCPPRAGCPQLVPGFVPTCARHTTRV